MSKKQKLELTWIGKDVRPKVEPCILLEDPAKSYHAKFRHPLHETVEQGNVDAVRLLLKKGAKKNIANNDGSIASDIARQLESEEILALLQ